MLIEGRQRGETYSESRLRLVGTVLSLVLCVVGGVGRGGGELVGGRASRRSGSHLVDFLSTRSDDAVSKISLQVQLLRHESEDVLLSNLKRLVHYSSDEVSYTSDVSDRSSLLHRLLDIGGDVLRLVDGVLSLSARLVGLVLNLVGSSGDVAAKKSITSFCGTIAKKRKDDVLLGHISSRLDRMSSEVARFGNESSDGLAVLNAVRSVNHVRRRGSGRGTSETNDACTRVRLRAARERERAPLAKSIE